MLDAWAKNSPNRLKARVLFERWGGPALIATTFFFLLAWTWRKWPDILVDFGRELYVPWQLAAGKVLYRDIAYLNGPLSPYINTLWMKVGGVSLTTLVVGNLIILSIITVTIYLLIKKSCNRMTATLVCLVFLSAFAFAHLMRIGNYNFICPYSHELTHGIALSLLIIYLFSRNVSRLKPVSLGFAGLLSGLLFLTKAEVAVALAPSLLAGFILIKFANNEAGKIFPSILFFLAGLMLPIALFYGYFCLHMPPDKALEAVAGAWLPLLKSRVARLKFYQAGMGLDEPWMNLSLMFLASLAVILLLSAAALVDHALINSGVKKLKLVVAGLLILGVILIQEAMLPWLLVGRALPVLTLVSGAIFGVLCYQRRTDFAGFAGYATLLMLSIFSLVLLSKIIFFSRLEHYGFSLAMPATIILVVLCVWLLPIFLKNSYRGGFFFLILIITVLFADIAFYAVKSNHYYSKKKFKVGSGHDLIFAYNPEFDERVVGVTKFLKKVDAILPAGAQFLVLPEGVVLNYLTRKVNPTPFTNFMPPELEIYGESAILTSFKQNPPDFVVLVHSDTYEYGKDFFGREEKYGKNIMDWINKYFTPILVIENEPLQDDNFGIKILKRKNVMAENIKGSD